MARLAGKAWLGTGGGGTPPLCACLVTGMTDFGAGRGSRPLCVLHIVTSARASVLLGLWQLLSSGVRAWALAGSKFEMAAARVQKGSLFCAKEGVTVVRAAYYLC